MDFAGQRRVERGVVDAAFLAQLQVPGVQLVGERGRAGDQRGRSLVVVRGHAVRVEVRQTHQVAAEQQALDVGERQVADEFALAAGLDGVDLVAEALA